MRNSIKFTESGSITVTAGAGNATRWIEVRDTGIGIPVQHRDNIFERFQQVDSSSTRKYEGTGLGLTIVKEAVNLMRGKITLQSEEGRGTTIRVQLPDNLEQLSPDAFVDRRSYSQRRAAADHSYDGEDRRRKPRRESDVAHISVDNLALIEKEQLSRGLEDDSASSPAPPAQQAEDSVLLVETMSISGCTSARC